MYGKKSGLFKIEIAMAVPVMGDFIFMIYAWAFNCHILLLIPAPEAAGTVRSSELFLVPYQSPDNR